MNKRAFSAVSILILAFAASHTAAASTLYLDYQGLTGDPVLVGGVPVAPAGTGFSISAEFSTVSGASLGLGDGLYTVTSISIDVDGVSYSDTSDALLVGLTDATDPSLPGLYAAAILNQSTHSDFLPLYTGTTATGWSAVSPTPTVFTGYSGTEDDILSFDTTAGNLVFDFDPSTGLNAEISAVPEGGTFTYLAMGIALLGLGAVVTRKGVTGSSPAGSLI